MDFPNGLAQKFICILYVYVMSTSLGQTKMCNTPVYNVPRCRLSKGTLNTDVDSNPGVIPPVSPSSQYALQRNNMMFDPSIVNTPPSEFMNTLKQRMGVYYESSASSN